MYRVIWKLSDGRKKYSTSKGKPELWSETEIKFLDKINGAYTEDLELFFPQKIQAIEIGYKNLIDIIGYELEKADSELSAGILI